MSQEYVFEFSGTKEDFFNKLECFPNNSEQFYYFDDYIVKVKNNEIHFGVQRAGHSGGYWFIPTITEYDDKIQFKGIIKYIGPEHNPTTDSKNLFKKCIEKIGTVLWSVLLLPFVLAVLLIVGFCELFKWIIRKEWRNPKTKLKTTEEKLTYLMEKHLDCIRI